MQQLDLCAAYYPHDQVKPFETEQGVGVHSFLSDQYYLLKGVAAVIWRNLDGRVTAMDLVEKLREHFEVEPKQLVADVSQFLQQLIDAQLIVKAEG